MKDEYKKHPMDWNAKLVRFFFDNGKLVWMIIVILLLGGFFSLVSFKKEGFPNVSLKTVAIQSIYPGASANEVESKVTKEIEASIKDAKGMKDFSSVSNNSFSQVVVNFDESVNLDQAVQDVQSKVSAAKSNLPAEVENPRVMTWSTSGAAFTYGVTEPGKKLDEIRAEAVKIGNEIESIANVKKVDLQDPEKQIIISVDEAKLSALNIPTSVLTQIIKGNNLNFPTGTIENEGKIISTITLGTLTGEEDIRNLALGMNPLTRSVIRLADVAAISQGSASTDTVERMGYSDNGKLVAAPGVYLNISLTKGGDFITVKKLIDKKIAHLRDVGSIDSDLKIEVLYDQAGQTQNQIMEIVDATVGSGKNYYLLGGIQLLFIAMLLLVNWRAALLAALALPFSFGFTFLAMKLMGVDLNTIVLFSLILVLGLVVDPAIVMVEAIQRYRDLKYPSRESVIESGRRYGASLFMAVLTSLIVFIPFGVVSGYFGEIIRFMPLTIIPALLASYLVPIALLPYLSRKFLKGSNSDQGTITSEDENLSKAAVWVMKANKWILGSFWHKFTIVAAAIILIGLSVSIVATGKIQIVQFAKPNDTTFLLAQGTYPKGLNLQSREDQIEKLEQNLAQEQGVKSYFLAQENSQGFMMYINLKEKAERKDKNDASPKITSRIGERAKTMGLDDILVYEISAGPPVGGYQIQTQLAGSDLKKLEAAALTTGEYLRQQEHVIKVDDGFTGKRDTELQISFDRSRAEKMGISVFEVASQIKTELDKSEAGKIDQSNGDSLEIYLKSDKKYSTADDLKNIVLVNSAKKSFTLADVANVTLGDGIGIIERYNGTRFVTIQGRVDDTKNTMAVQKKLDGYLTADKIKEFGLDGKVNKGDVGDITKSFTDLGIALAIAILLTYLVLVLQFKSFSLPGIMLFTIPLSLIGVFPALWIFGSQFGFLELLGITILVGIVENVAIFLIDYANQLVKEQGLSPKEAIIKASGVRFRPILLTKLVALGGLLPLAIESDMWRGLSLVIIAGIGLSGFFSLAIIPILYVWIMNLRGKIYKKPEWRLAKMKP